EAVEYSSRIACGIAYVFNNVLSRIFFFQAEDGIRYSSVTGVQTCALPICKSCPAEKRRFLRRVSTVEIAEGIERTTIALPREMRSEERRVGKEWRNGGGEEERRKKGAETMNVN